MIHKTTPTFIEHPDYRKLKTIIKFDPEAYFYWYKSIEILTLKNLRGDQQP